MCSRDLSNACFQSICTSDVESVVGRVMAGERIYRFESEVLRSDGMPVPVWLSLCPIFDAFDSPVSAVVIARDVTEQRLAQAAWPRWSPASKRARALAHVGSWLWDVRTGTVQWSGEFHRIHGFDPLEFDGTFEFQLSLIHPEDRDAVSKAMEVSADVRDAVRERVPGGQP